MAVNTPIVMLGDKLQDLTTTAMHSSKWQQVRIIKTTLCEFVINCRAAQMKFGAVWTPKITLLVLRVGSEEIRLNSMKQALLAGFKSSVKNYEWHFVSEDSDYRVEGTITAPKQSFVALKYYNPPGN